MPIIYGHDVYQKHILRTHYTATSSSNGSSPTKSPEYYKNSSTTYQMTMNQGYVEKEEDPGSPPPTLPPRNYRATQQQQPSHHRNMDHNYHQDYPRYPSKQGNLLNILTSEYDQTPKADFYADQLRQQARKISQAQPARYQGTKALPDGIKTTVAVSRPVERPPIAQEARPPPPIPKDANNSKSLYRSDNIAKDLNYIGINEENKQQNGQRSPRETTEVKIPFETSPTQNGSSHNDYVNPDKLGLSSDRKASVSQTSSPELPPPLPSKSTHPLGGVVSSGGGDKSYEDLPPPPPPPIANDIIEDVPRKTLDFSEDHSPRYGGSNESYIQHRNSARQGFDGNYRRSSDTRPPLSPDDAHQGSPRGENSPKRLSPTIPPKTDMFVKTTTVTAVKKTLSLSEQKLHVDQGPMVMPSEARSRLSQSSLDSDPRSRLSHSSVDTDIRSRLSHSSGDMDVRSRLSHSSVETSPKLIQRETVNNVSRPNSMEDERNESPSIRKYNSYENTSPRDWKAQNTNKSSSKSRVEDLKEKLRKSNENLHALTVKLSPVINKTESKIDVSPSGGYNKEAGSPVYRGNIHETHFDVSPEVTQETLPPPRGGSSSHASPAHLASSHISPAHSHVSPSHRHSPTHPYMSQQDSETTPVPSPRSLNHTPIPSPRAPPRRRSSSSSTGEKSFSLPDQAKSAPSEPTSPHHPKIAHVRQKSQEEIDCEQQAAILASRLREEDKRLSDVILPPPDHKHTTSYLMGLFDTRVPGQRRPVSRPPRERSHTTRSAMPCPPSHAETPVEKQKEELICRIERKLDMLRDEKADLEDEVLDNKDLGAKVTSVVEMKCQRKAEFDKYKLYVDELDKVMYLLLKISERLAKADNALLLLPEDCDPSTRSEMTSKRDEMVEKLDDAKLLKDGIDRRSKQVAEYLKKYLNDEEYLDYEYFITMKAKLTLDQKEIEEQIKMGEDQLQALQKSMASSQA